MAEGFLQLPKEERRDALGVAAAKSGRPTHLLEKDVWVVWALSAMFESEFGPHLVFKRRDLAVEGLWSDSTILRGYRPYL